MPRFQVLNRKSSKVPEARSIAKSSKMNHELQGVEELEQIFPLYSRSDLARILSENGTNMELTIDAIFALEASKESASLQTPPTPTQPMPK